MTALLLLAASAGRAAPPSGAMSASLDGVITVSVTSPTLKHWGVPAADAAFVPDSDLGPYARAIREAAGADALCAAIARAAAADTSIATARVDGDGNLEHRSGDEVRLDFHMITAGVASATPGRLYLCSSPVVAIMSRGNYPDERFQQAEGHRLSWIGRRISLHPGEHAHVHLTASIDASQW